MEEKELLQNNENEEVKEEVLNDNEIENLENLEDKQETNDEPIVEEKPLEKTPMESIIETSTTYDYPAQKHCQMYRLRVKGHSLLINLGFLLVILGITVYLFITEEGYLFSIFGALFSLYQVYNIVFEERKIDKFLQKFFLTNDRFTLNYYINNDMIRFTQMVDGEERWADIPWAYVQEVHRVEEYYFLFVSGSGRGQSILIIKRDASLITKGSLDELDTLVKKACEFKSYVVYNKKYFSKLIDVKYKDELNTNSSTITSVEENDNKDSE